MGIEIRGGENPSHLENLIYFAYCYDCPNISEEDGDILCGPAEIAQIYEHLTLEDVVRRAEAEHAGHKVVINIIDVGKTRKDLWS